MKEKFSFREMLCYAFGDMGCNFIWTTVASFLMLYYTNSVGISAAATGTLMLITRLLDGVSDLVAGFAIDRTKTKWGKARPWILWTHFQVAQGNIHAYVFGEHGDTSFIPWTGAYISGLSTDEYYEEMKAHGKDVKPLDKEAMLEYVQKSGGKVIAKKGATFYAVSATVCQLVGLILAASDSLATVSSMLHGEYGIEDVCLSTLTLVGPNGIQGKVQMRMNKEEVELLKKSANALKEVIAQIEL